MTFYPNAPAPTDNVSTSQGQLQSNNQFLSSTAGNSVITTGDPTGYYHLPNGLIIQWGAKTNQSSTTTRTVTFPVAYSADPYSINVTPQRDTASPGSTFGFYIDDTTVSTTGFNIINISGHAYAFYWMAIGPA
jgi:hypothetical protein